MDEKSNKTAPKSDLEKTDLKQVLTKLKVDPKTGQPLVIQHNCKQLCSCYFGWLVPRILLWMICEVWIYNIAWMFVLNIIRILIEKAQAKK